MLGILLLELFQAIQGSLDLLIARCQALSSYKIDFSLLELIDLNQLKSKSVEAFHFSWSKLGGLSEKMRLKFQLNRCTISTPATLDIHIYIVLY